MDDFSGSEKRHDLVSIFAKAGKGIKKLFSPSKERKTAESQPASARETENDAGHRFSFGVVYANALANAEILSNAPNFPIGSMIVREKNSTETSFVPQTVIAMVKREKGFSAATGDWEFFVLNGSDLKLQRRETVGNCAACHIQAKNTDWVFQGRLK